MDGERKLPSHAALSASQAMQIDRICSEFERQWKSGSRLPIEQLLNNIDPAIRNELLRELVALEVEYRQRAGESVHFGEFRTRFPDDAEQLRVDWPSLAGQPAESSPPTPHRAAGSGGARSSSPSDLNLLFGILALQMGFVSRDALLSGMNAWVLRKESPLSELLLEADALGADECALLEALVAKHLERHGGDPEESLAALSPVAQLRDEMARMDDTDVAHSLLQLADSPAGQDPNATRLGDLVSLPQGTRFRVLRPHAEGGLGQVSVAQDEELHREVALKEIRPAIAHDANLRARFVLEAEITGGLEHPGIVPVYGLGQYADGRPFYAMRFIRGNSLKEAATRFHKSKHSWSDTARRLELRQLLGRFVDVCQAIEYAHSRGVLHRDLKPGNIMLGKYGETLVVDWGLAKAKGRDPETTSVEESLLKPSSGSHSDPTAMGSAVGTPGYMSPEQAAGKVESLGRSSDVYGLGATLYHVLTGQTPVSGTDLGVVLQRVQQGDYPAAREVNSQVPKALAAICSRAMALKPEDRYNSAAELAEDVERYLADETVRAYRERATERVARWFRKHRTVAVLSVSTLTLITLISGLSAVVIGGQNARIKQQERKATAMAMTNEALAKKEMDARKDAEELKRKAENAREAAVAAQREAEKLAIEKAALADSERAEAQKAKRLSEFLIGSFEAADPLGIGGIPFYIPRNTGEMLTVRDLLDRGNERVDTDLAEDPEVQATVKDTIGNVYRSLGLLKEAELLLVSALEQRRQILPADHLDIAQSCHDLAWLYHERGDFRRAEPLYREALTIRQRRDPQPELLVAASMQNLGWLLAQDEQFEEGKQWFQKTIDVRSRILGPKHRDTGIAYLGMALCVIEMGRWPEAIAYAAQARSVLLESDENAKLNQAVVKCVQALIVDKTIGPNAAEKLLAEAQELVAETMGDEHIYIGFIVFERARRLDELERDEDAEKCYKAALKIAREKVQMQHPRIRILCQEYGGFLVRRNRTDEAMALWTEFLKVQEARFGTESPVFADSLVGYALTQLATDDRQGARKTLEKAIPVFKKAEKLERLAFLTGANELALMLVSAGEELEYAEELLRHVLAHAEKRFGAKTREMAELQVNMGRALSRQKKFDDSEAYFQLAEQNGKSLVGRKRRPCLDYVYWWQSRMYKRARRHSEFMKAVQDMVDLWPDNPEEEYLAAAEFASGVALVSDDADDPEAAREESAARAVALLGEAIENGYQDVDEIRRDKRWDRIRERPDFQGQVGKITPESDNDNS